MTLAEDSPVGSFLAHISVQDQDTKDNGRFNCSLNTESFSLLRKYDSEYHLVTAVVLDRELKDQYQVVMTCQDAGVPSLTSSLTFDVKVSE